MIFSFFLLLSSQYALQSGEGVMEEVSRGSDGGKILMGAVGYRCAVPHRGLDSGHVGQSLQMLLGFLPEG